MSEINRWSLSAGGTVQNAAGYFPEGQAPSTLNDAARTIMAELRRDWQTHNPDVTATYSAQTYSITYDRNLSSGELSQIFCAIADSPNTGTAYVNINVLGAKELIGRDGSHLQASAVAAQMPMLFAYHKARDAYVLLADSSPPYPAINQLPVNTTLASTDLLDAWDSSAGQRVQITVANAGAVINPASGCSFHVTPASDQSGIANATPTQVTFGTETYDNGTVFASSTFTAPATGIYSLRTTVQTLTAIADGAVVEIWFETGAGAVLASARESNGGASVVGLNLSWEGQLSSTTTVVVKINHSHGSNISLDAASTRGQMFFAGHRIS